MLLAAAGGFVALALAVAVIGTLPGDAAARDALLALASP